MLELECYRARAHAKINLGLKIVGRRADGYHELRTIFQTVALADGVEVRFGLGRGVALEVEGAEAAGVPGDERNLAWRAAAMGAQAMGVKRHIAIRLTKRIPAGAGLGGGSSDAAAVLRILAAATGFRAGGVLKLAGELGSDVAAFLLGGTVLGLGRGEEVYALPDLAPWHCVLAMPNDGPGAMVSTVEAFAAWDRKAARQGALTEAGESDTLLKFCSLVDQVLPAFRPGRNRADAAVFERRQTAKVQAGIENDFQPEVFSRSADFPRIHRQLQRRQAVWVSLTGSGAAQYGLFRDGDKAEAAAARLRGYRVWRTRLLGRRGCHRGLQGQYPQGWGVVQWQDTCL